MRLATTRCNFGKHSKRVRALIRKCSGISTTARKETPVEELDVAYVPCKIEGTALRKEFFEPPIGASGRFSLILPPPNVTGTLHLGHALTATVQDVLVKWHRLRGRETVWVPGMDHAGIATQVIVEKKLWTEQKKTRHDLGRDPFEAEVWKWKTEKAKVINEQLRRLGVSLDWSREMFTMDRKQSEAVAEAFVRLFDDGLVYEADSLVNWSCVLRSAISDIEVEHTTVKGRTRLVVPGYERPIEFGTMTEFAYKVVGSDDQEEIIVATTRPETVLGDVAVAVHPEDQRYSALIGKHLWHPFREESLPVIGDRFVDPNFGTGAVKITPAHDPLDFEVGKRHRLAVLSVIDEEGRISEAVPRFGKMARFDARDAVVDALGRLGLLRGRREHEMSVPLCGRSKDVVEFLVKPQWFVMCDGMAERALKDVEEGRLGIEPRRLERMWKEWLGNIRDWCVSRQLWWGHRIPIYICHKPNDPNNVCKVAAISKDEALAKAKNHFGSSDLTVRQVDDVLDTWFSSALLPFSAFGWPTQTQDYAKYYPLSLMETGNDILFFWVARMTMLGTHLTGRLPFDKVLLHGVVCDASGHKMSKSLGNVVSPEDIIYGRTLQDLENSSEANLKSGTLSREEFRNAVRGQKKMFPRGIPECGVDALRYTLCSHNIKSQFINFDVQECKANQHFGNKLWQVTKFAVKWCKSVAEVRNLKEVPKSLDNMDRWILSRLSFMVKTVNESLENYELHTATSALKSFLYFDFCDVYVESTKRGLKDVSSLDAANHCWTLATCLDHGFRCLAPFMPYLAQHLHPQLGVHPAIYTENVNFPQEVKWIRDESIEKDVEAVLRVVTAIRRLKKIFNVTAKHRREAVLITARPPFEAYAQTIGDLAGLERISLRKDDFPDEDYVSDTMADGVIVRLHVPDALRKSFEADAVKLLAKRGKLVEELEKMKGRTASDRMPQDAKEINLRKIAGLEEKIARIDYIRGIVGKS